MSEVYKASGSITIDVNQAVIAFNTIEKKSKQSTTEIEKSTTKTKKFGEKLSGFGDKMTKKVTLPLMGIATASFKLASDLNENINKADVVFKGNAATVEKWADTSLQKMGMCKSSALEMAAKFGDMGSAMGLNSQQTMDYSMNLTQLAADLASFKNISIERASQALTGVYTGETESLKGLGYVMTQTNLQAFALATGFKKASGNSIEAQKAAIGVEKAQKKLNETMKKYGKNSLETKEASVNLASAQDKLKKAMNGGTLQLTQAEQVQLRYKYIMAQTKDAQGDFARTSDQAANAGRIFKESVKALGGTIGTNLLPIFTPFINDANKLIQKFAGMSEGQQHLILGLGGFAAAIGPVTKGISNFGKGVKRTTKFIKDFPGNIKKGVGAIKKFAVATKNGTNLLGKFGKGLIKATKAVGKFTLKLIKAVGKGLLKFGKAIVSCIKSLGKFTLKLIQATGRGLLKFGKAILSCIKSFGKFTLAILKNTGVALKNAAIWVAQKAKLLAYKAAQLAVTGATKAMTLAQKALNLVMETNPIILVITLLLGLAAVFVTLYNKCAWFRNGVNAVWSKITNIFNNFSNFLSGIFATDWTKSFGIFGNIINAFMHNLSNIFSSIKNIFGGLIDFITGVFTGNWSKAWHGVVRLFGGIMSGLSAVVKAPLNAVIGLINMAIDGLNSISFTVPSFIPGIGGKHFGVNIPKMSYLYTGAVFDEPTLLGNNTVVGDKFKGQGSQREYVLPEPMIRKVVSEEVTKAINQLGIYLDGRQVGRCLAKYKDEMDNVNRSLNPFLM